MTLRFLQFRKQVLKCPKTIIRNLYNIFQYDASSLTGSNFRKIMLMCDKTSIKDVEVHDIDQLTYFECPENEVWRISLINELINIRANPSKLLPGFTIDEVEDMLSFACVS